MGEWWEQGYKGGGPVKAPFPRPLYPPDASRYGKQPSVDGDDVTAYKRALCRAGRWGKWDPSLWDDSYSNGFAHGKGPNVKDTGLAGFQRQQHIDDTGWLGQKTFDNMRYALISDPAAEHYGDPIFDGQCVQLLEAAYERFGGHEPDNGQGTVRQAALACAAGELGYKENPAGSNNNRYGQWYGLNYQPWCAMFVSWCQLMNGRAASPSFIRGSRYSYVPYVVGDARNNQCGLKVTGDPVAGDLVCYDWEWNGEFDHIGLFEEWQMGAGDFTAIEGNTSTSSDSNGGQVMRRTRSVSGQNTVFVRVQEP